MRARRDLRHHTAIWPVLRLLRGELVRQHAAVTRHQRGGGLVTGGFEAQNKHGDAPTPRRSLCVTLTLTLTLLVLSGATSPLSRLRMQVFRLGTRGSPLALTQARMVAAALCAAHGWSEDAVELVVIKTTGDRVQDRALSEIGGKALWTKELDRALFDGTIDAAGPLDEGCRDGPPLAALVIAATLPRADVRDRLIGCGDRRSSAPRRPRRHQQPAPRRPSCSGSAPT